MGPNTKFESTLPDEPLTDTFDDAAQGEIEVSLGDETPSQSIVEARRGQNEPTFDDNGDEPIEGGEPRAARDDGDIAQERRRFEAERRRALESEQGYQKALYEQQIHTLVARREQADTAITTMDLRIEMLSAALKAAKVDGDVSNEIDFASKLDDCKKQRDKWEQIKSSIPSDREVADKFGKWRDERAQQLEREAPAAPRIPTPRADNPMAQRWAQQNTWISDPAYQAQQQYLIQVDSNLAAEGYDPKSNEHYQEMARRVARKFPSLVIKDQSGRTIYGPQSRQPANHTQGGPPVASARITQSRNAQGKTVNRVRIDADEQRLMRTLGLDPSDTKKVGGMTVAQRFAKEKMERLRSERANGRG
jgi:hypothetical protein